MNRAHKIRLYPTVKREIAFRKACGVRRYAYNWALARWKDLKAQGVKMVTQKMLKEQWNKEKKVIAPWVYESPKDANLSALDDFHTALTNYYREKKKAEKTKSKKKIGFPQFKKKGKSKDSFYVSNDKFRVMGKKVVLPVIGSVRMAEELRFVGKIMSGVVSRIAGQWHLSISVEVPDVPKQDVVKKHDIVGIDLGVKRFATLSTGEVIESSRAYGNALGKLRRQQREVSRRAKGGRNREKSKMLVSRTHLRIANIRKDFLHKLSTRICRESQAVVLEDLSVANMVKNRHLALAVSDTGMGEFRRQCEYKGLVLGCEVEIASRWFPSTKTCNVCGAQREMLLEVRTYKCEACGNVADRDFNASLNLRDYHYTLGLRGIDAHGHCGSSDTSKSVLPPTVVEVGNEPVLSN